MFAKIPKLFNKKIFLILLITGFILAIFFFIKNNNILQKESSTSLQNQKITEACSRKKPFNLEPEFINALDLIDQRSGRGERFDAKTGASRGTYSYYFPVLDDRNCLNIFYSNNINNQAGTVAMFDSSSSTFNNIIIKVNKNYLNKNSDVLEMAVILAHELTHAEQLDEERYYSKKISCIDKETGAFVKELKFIALLKPEEKNKLSKIMEDNNSILRTVRDLWIEQDKAFAHCDELKNEKNFNQDQYNTCLWNKTEELTKDFIINDPDYEKHCDSAKDN